MLYPKFVAYNKLQILTEPWNWRSTSWITTFSVVPFDGKYQPLKLIAFFASSHRFQNIFTFENSWTWKCMSKSWYTTFAMRGGDKFLTSYLMAMVVFSFFQLILVEIAIWKVWPWKFRSSPLTQHSSYVVQWWISTFIESIMDIFALALTVSR